MAMPAPAFDIKIGFKSPSGIGLSVDADTVTGAGFLFHDPTQGLYAGALRLSIDDRITVEPLRLIATGCRTAAGQFADHLYHRGRFPADAARAGLHAAGDRWHGGREPHVRSRTCCAPESQTDTLKSLLFPRDPVANAPAIIRSLASAFPARRGSYIRAAGRIGWVTPTLIKLDLSADPGVRGAPPAAGAGRISSLLPSADNDLVRINLDAIGVSTSTRTRRARRGAGGLAAGAQVRADGRGGAAGRVDGGAGIGFVLAVGGSHPRFAPPAGCRR